MAPSCVGFIEACEAINIPIVEDLNTGNGTGVKQGTGTLDGRLRRSSAFDSYYKQAKDRQNLDVLHDAVVEKLVFETSDNGTNRATGVQFTDHLTGEFFVVEASKEVIVSGGAFASPQMLMISVCHCRILHERSLTICRVLPHRLRWIVSTLNLSTSMRTSDNSQYIVRLDFSLLTMGQSQ